MVIAESGLQVGRAMWQMLIHGGVSCLTVLSTGKKSLFSGAPFSLRQPLSGKKTLENIESPFI